VLDEASFRRKKSCTYRNSWSNKKQNVFVGNSILANMIMVFVIIMSVSETDKMAVNAHPLHANSSSTDSTFDPMEVHIVDEDEQPEQSLDESNEKPNEINEFSGQDVKTYEDQDF
jgi:hypothetical protein